MPKLYEGAWGVTLAGDVVGPLYAVKHGELSGGNWFRNPYTESVYSAYHRVDGFHYQKGCCIIATFPTEAKARAYLSRPSWWRRVKGWLEYQSPSGFSRAEHLALWGIVAAIALVAFLTSCAPGIVEPPRETCEIPVDSTRGGGLLDSLGQYDEGGCE